MIVDVGPLGCPVSSGHGHADLLSVQCVVFGDPCLVDAGTGCYTPEPGWRNYFRSTAAHSTVRVDQRDHAEPAGPFRWHSRPRRDGARVAFRRSGRCARRRARRISATSRHVSPASDLRETALLARRRRSRRTRAASGRTDVSVRADARHVWTAPVGLCRDAGRARLLGCGICVRAGASGSDVRRARPDSRLDVRRLRPASAGAAVDLLHGGVAPVALPDAAVSGSCPVRVAAVREPALRRHAPTARARVPPLRSLAASSTTISAQRYTKRKSHVRHCRHSQHRPTRGS